MEQDFAVLQPPLSPFPITDAQFTAPHPFVLTWTSVANYTYQVQTRTNLILGNWEPLTNITATGPVTSWTNSPASEPTAFFRIFAPTP